MHHHNNPAARICIRAGKLHDLQLVPQIKAGNGLLQK